MGPDADADDRDGGRVPRARRTARWLPFVPSVALGVLAGAVWLWRPPPVALLAGPGAPVWLQVVAGAATAAGFLALAEALERVLPSFRFASRFLERALRGLGIRRREAVALALGTSLAEELAFRGLLLAWFGLIPQALVFGLLHPATRRGWSYSVFTAIVGVALGGLTLAFGGLLAALVAHAVVNGVGLWQVAGRPRTARRARAQSK